MNFTVSLKLCFILLRIRPKDVAVTQYRTVIAHGWKLPGTQAFIRCLHLSSFVMHHCEYGYHAIATCGTGTLVQTQNRATLLLLHFVKHCRCGRGRVFRHGLDLLFCKYGGWSSQWDREKMNCDVDFIASDSENCITVYYRS